MPTQRHPILVWCDSSGASTAALVGDSDHAAACAATAEEALRQLKELLEWRLEHDLWSAGTDFSDASLCEIKVEVRPQYAEGERLLPSPDTVWLKIPCVTGKQENGLLIASVPHLKLRFDYQDAAALQSLTAHFVKEALHGLTPLQLAGRLPPRNCRLEEIVLRESARNSRRVLPEQRAELKVLFAVANPLLHDLGRGKRTTAAFGRESLAEQLAARLGKEKANLLLVGEAGVGKSTVLLDAAKRCRHARSSASGDDEDEEGERDLRKYRFWRGSAGRMIAGMRYLGEWEERCESFIEQLATIQGVFCAENLLELVQVGGEGAEDSVGAFLLPYLQRGELRLVAESTPSEVEACRRLFPELLDVFQIVPVPVFSESEAEAVLNRLASTYGTAGRMEIHPGVADLTRRLFQRFQPYAVLPGPAARFLRGLCDHRPDRTSVSRQDVMTAFTKLTGLPEVFLRDDLPLDIEQVKAEFSARVIGQSDATATAAGLITTIKAGLADPGRPFAVMLFCGPTGVGKTEMVQTLAHYCFGADDATDRFVRLDMSEYSGWGSAQRLLQAPNGRPAPWIERVRQQPFCVVLFDEIEKASSEVFDALLALLDEGRLSDRFGRVTQFRSAIIVMTSNLGANANAAPGFVPSAGRSYESEVSKFFRPEFFNRLDAVVTFRPLSTVDVEAIARKELRELAAREGFVTAGIRLEWSEALVATVARAGYDHRFGARPLQRAIERMVATPLARWKVSNPTRNNLTVKIGVDGRGAVVLTAI